MGGCGSRAGLVVSSKRDIFDRPKSPSGEKEGKLRGHKPFSFTTTDSEDRTADPRTPCLHIAPLLCAAVSVECVS